MDDRLMGSLIELMRWANRTDVRREVWALRGVELSPTELSLMLAIDQRAPVRQTTLATAQGLDKSTLSPQVRRLERLGMVGRTADPADARATLLHLTPLGQETAADLQRSAADLLEAKLSDWSGEDREALAVLLERLVDDLDPGRASGAAAG